MKIAAVTLGFLLVSPTATEGDGKNYEFDVSETSQQVSRGDEGTFQLRIQARPGFKVSQEAPLKITLRSDGLALKKKLLKTLIQFLGLLQALQLLPVWHVIRLQCCLRMMFNSCFRNLLIRGGSPDA